MKLIIQYIRNAYIKRMISLRTHAYSLVFKSFGKGSSILGSIKVLKPENIIIGKNTTLNVGCFLNARDTIIIGDYVHISPYVLINTGGLDYTRGIKDRNHIKKKVIINDGVWIGSGAIINPGVEIGKGSVIGSGAVVTKDIPPNVVAVGIPAKVIKEIAT